MYEKRRLELIIENMALSRACNVLEDAGLTGYTVLQAVAGFGGGSGWKSRDDLSDTREMAVVIAIGDDERIERALHALNSLLSEHIGVLSVGTVRVLRDERF
jgi:PII-like signaling protein